MKENEKTFTQKEVDEQVKKMLTECELRVSKQRDKILELKNENINLIRKIEEYDKREVEVATAIEKYQSRNKYLENIIKMRCELEISRLNELNDFLHDHYADFESVAGKQLNTIINSLQAFSKDITEVEEIGKIEPSKRTETNKEKDLEKRYYQIMSLYEYTKAQNETRKRGRPKKEEQNIETFLKQKKQEKEKEKAESFDFEEALNPTQSLEEIMKVVLDEEQ